MSIQYDLQGGGVLFVTWGRVGGRHRTRSETFHSPLALERRQAELLARRRRHGYLRVTARTQVSRSVDAPDMPPLSVDRAQITSIRLSNGHFGVVHSGLGILARDLPEATATALAVRLATRCRSLPPSVPALDRLIFTEAVGCFAAAREGELSAAIAAG